MEVDNNISEEIPKEVEKHITSKGNRNIPTHSYRATNKIFQVHTAIILGNLGIFTCIIGILLFFSFLIPPLYFTFLLILTLATAGTIFLIIPNFSKWWGLFPSLTENISWVVVISKWVLAISIVSSATSLILMIADKEKRTSKRITGCIVTLVIAIIALVIRTLNILEV